MYPARFRYEAPRSLAEAVSLLHEGGGEAKVLAGGQSLVPLMKLRFATPELLVDINNIGGLASSPGRSRTCSSPTRSPSRRWCRRTGAPRRAAT